MEVIEELKILQSAKSKIYKSALQFHTSLCLGFILGSQPPAGGTVLEFPLVAFQNSGLMDLPITAEIAELHKYLVPATLTAKDIGRSLLGIFGGWDHHYQRSVTQMRLGALVDYAIQIDVPYILVVPTDGGESIWGIRAYYSHRFPCSRQKYKTIRKRSTLKSDNLRRVQAVWRKILSGLENDIGKNIV